MDPGSSLGFPRPCHLSRIISEDRFTVEIAFDQADAQPIADIDCRIHNHDY
jgi:hypothetical protein